MARKNAKNNETAGSRGRRRYKNRLENADFNQIKVLAQSNLKSSQIAEVLGWSSALISVVRKFNDYESYVSDMRRRIAEYKTRRNGQGAVAESQERGGEAESFSGDVFQQQLLSKLDRIADALERR